jgi:UDP-N-acetylmuramyl pentapeptide phosphotransferase/UDP-N-acetylglucosamine-1-phosphate transferase
MVGFVGLGVAVVVLSYLGVWGTRYLAARHKILDIPNERSSHTQSVARGGGLAIVLLTLGGFWVYVILNPAPGRWALLAYTVGAMLIVVISWLDDLRPQPNWLRFGIHSIGALLAIYAFGYLNVGTLITGNPVVTRVLGLMITFLWIVGLTNAYNFMDGIDGIAGGQAVVAGVGCVAIGWLSGQSYIVAMGVLLAAANLGFLFHNWSPASIFMGDVGSAFLGYSFAVLPLMLNWQLQEQGAFKLALAAILPLWPFLFDSTFTILRRLRRGENVFSAHRSHLYQRLVIAGYTHASVSLLYCAMAVVGVIFAVGWMFHLRNTALTALIVLPLIWLSFVIFVTKQEQKQARKLATPQPTFVDPV